MNTDAVKEHLRKLKQVYVSKRLWEHGAGLASHLGEYEAYHNIFGSHLAEFLHMYEKQEAKIIAEEHQQLEEVNAAAESKAERMTVDAMNKRIDVRLADIKGKKKMMEMEYKTNLTHVNVCQSLLKNFNDEAKSMR